MHITSLQKAPTVDIGPDLSSVINQYPDKILPYAVIRGCVTAVEGTLESSTGMNGVIKITTLHEITAKRFGDSWDVDKMPPVNEFRESVPFALKPLLNSNEATNFLVTVENPFESIWENLVIPTSSCFTPSNSSVNSVVMGAVGRAKLLGVRKTEKFLPIGTIVTGIGRLVMDEQDGGLKLQQPLKDGSFCPYILTTLDYQDFIRKLELRRNIQRVAIGMTLTFAAAIIIRKTYGWWKQYKLNLLRNSLMRERRNVNLDNLCRCQTCLVCLLNPREVIILNCGHVCVCADCIMKLNGLCPVCREPIVASHKAYIV